jgi:hypothetical protein
MVFETAPMKLARKGKRLLLAVAIAVAAGIAYVSLRPVIMPKPLSFHVGWLLLKTGWDPTTDAPPEQLATANREIMARYHPERVTEAEKYVREHYGLEYRTRIEAKRLRLGEVVTATVTGDEHGFAEVVLSGGQFGAPVRARLFPDQASISERATIWLDATVCTPEAENKLVKDDWWISQYEQHVTDIRFVIDGEVVLPGQGKTVVLRSREIEMDSRLPRGASLAEDGTLFCDVTPWRSLVDTDSLMPEKLAQLFPDVWRSYAPDPDDLPTASFDNGSMRASKEHRTILLGEVETAELDWGQEPNAQTGLRRRERVVGSRRSHGRSLAALKSVDLEEAELGGPLFSFWTGRRGGNSVRFVACRDLAGILRAGEQYEVYRDSARIIQVASATLEADFWVTRVRDADGRWRIEREQFHEYTLSLGPEEQRIYGEVVVRRTDRIYTTTLEPKHYQNNGH